MLLRSGRMRHDIKRYLTDEIQAIVDLFKQIIKYGGHLMNESLFWFLYQPRDLSRGIDGENFQGRFNVLVNGFSI
jgi:hypothetical protein